MPEIEDPRALLLARFDDAMFDVYRRAKAEVGYNATRFLEMLSADGGLGTARRLIAAPTVSDGFTALWEAGRQDLTMEAVVLRPEFRELFSTDELQVAASRLGQPIPPPIAEFLPPDPVADDAAHPIREVATTAVNLEAGDSLEQREAERVLLGLLERRIGIKLAPQRFGEGEGLRTDVDGYSAAPPVLVEAWAHIGPPKGGQKGKVITDVLKLVWIEQRFLKERTRKIILFADPAAAGHFQRRSWMAAALRDLDIELLVEELPPDIRAQVVAAQARQFR